MFYLSSKNCVVNICRRHHRNWRLLRHSKLGTMDIGDSNVQSASFSEDIGGMRKKYRDSHDAFLEEHIAVKEPFNLFKIWFEEACKNPEIIEPNAMCLATSSKNGIPSARYVLMKGYGHDGFKFFTNYSSRKGSDLAENPVAALNFYWPPLLRQIRIEGSVEKLSSSESEEYFHSRPIDSQVGAYASHQGTVIPSREYLIKAKEDTINTYVAKGQIVPKPQEWGGFIVKPDKFEFWQGQSDRLHDRIVFRHRKPGESLDGILLHKAEGDWVYERLSP